MTEPKQNVHFAFHKRIQQMQFATRVLDRSSMSDLSLRWVLRTVCLFCHAARSLSLGRTHGLRRLGLMMMLSDSQLQVASNFDHRRAQSVRRSTDDFNFVGLIPHLILVCHIFSVLLFFLFAETLDISDTH